MPKFKIEILSKVSLWEVNEVTFVCENKEQIDEIIKESNTEWIKHYDNLFHQEFLLDTAQDEGEYDIRLETLEQIEE